MTSCKMIINGNEVGAQNAFEVINPATGLSFATAPIAELEHVNRAVESAKTAFSSWRQTSGEERKRLCHALAEALQTNMPELMQLVTKESGKPLNGLNGVGAGMEVGGAIAWTQFTAELDLPVDVIQDDDDTRIEIHHKPLGVVASITPWNWPLMIAMWHIIPALRSGNTVVIKPSEYTPVATCRFVELANEILPPGVLNVITGFGDTGASLVSHPDVNKIIFTGSTSTGQKIMTAASVDLKRLTLELGGNDAGIVLPDADLARVAPSLFQACFHNNGQTCAALKRLYVHESQYEEMCDLLADIANNTVVGDGLDEDTELGPVQNAKQLQIISDLADAALAEGGRFICGGKSMDRDGYFFQPTVVADLTNGSRLVDEEPFGPIVPIIKYATIDEAMHLANESNRGLGGSIWSSNVEKAAELAAKLESGSAWVNEHGAIQPNAPFGGIKQSGLGVEFGLDGLKEYTSIQTIKIAKR